MTAKETKMVYKLIEEKLKAQSGAKSSNTMTQELIGPGMEGMPIGSID